MTQSEPRHSEAGRTRRRLLIVVNPTAGRRLGRLDAVLNALNQADCHVSVEFTKAAGDAEAMARSADRSAVDVVVAAGGDGTINEVANGLARNPAAPPLGVIPLGTANVFATEIGLGRNPQRIARTLVEAKAKSIYPGQVNGRLFLIMASVGFDARVVADVNLVLKRRLGKAAYLFQSTVEVWRRPSRKHRVRIDDAEYNAAGIIAAKGRHYGGTFILARDADLTRPDFELCLLCGGGRLDILRQAVALGRDRFDRLDGVVFRRAAQVDILGPAGEPVQADGDIVAHLPATIEVSTKPLLVLGPRTIG